MEAIAVCSVTVYRLEEYFAIGPDSHKALDFDCVRYFREVW